MSNQKSSPPGGASLGTTVGPIEQAFDLFFARFMQNGLSVEAKHNMQLTWYLASMATYNTLTDAMRAAQKDPQILSLITQAMKRDIDQYLSSNPLPAAAGSMGGAPASTRH